MDRKEMIVQLERIRKDLLERLRKRVESEWITRWESYHLDGERQTLVYGLCAEQGIDTKGMSPKEAWEALSNATGKSSEEILKNLKEPKRVRSKPSIRDYSHVCSEISTWYHRRFSERQGKLCCIDVGSNFYVFHNHEFGEYEFKKVISISGNEDYIRAVREIIYED